MDATDPQDDLDVNAFALAIEAFNRFYIRLPTLERFSFTTLSVLHTLSRTNPLRLTELTRTEQVTQPAITQLVTRLERDGLVERRPDPDDGRAVQVHITEAGLDIVRTRHRDRTTRLAAIVEQLDPGQRAAIAAALPALLRLAELGQGQEGKQHTGPQQATQS